MSERTMEERMATVEAEVTATKALAEKIDGKLDRWRDEHFTKEEVREMLRSRDKEVEELKSAFKDHLETEQSTRRENKLSGLQWVMIGVSALSGLGTIALVIVTITTNGHP